MIGVDGTGAVAYTFVGKLLVLEGDNLSELSGGPNLWGVSALARFRKGFLATGNEGFIQEYVPGVGFCPAQPIHLSSTRSLATLNDTVLAIGAASSSMRAVFLRARVGSPH